MSSLSSVLANMTAKERARDHCIETARNYLMGHNIDKRLMHRILGWMEFKHRLLADRGERESLMGMLPAGLREDLMLDLNQKFLYGIPMFFHVGKGFLGQLAAKMKFVEMLEGEKVLHYGELCDTLYVIFSGQCALLNAKGKLIVKMERGDFFGEFEVLQPRVQDFEVVVMQQSQISFVTKADLDEVRRRRRRRHRKRRR